MVHFAVIRFDGASGACQPESSAFSAFSAFSCPHFLYFSAFLLGGISSDPCFSEVRGTFRIFRIFPVSGSNR